MPAAAVNVCEVTQQSAARHSQPIPRFTLDGDDALENHLSGICATVLREVRRAVPRQRFEALLLGGGYGRGEGGVLRTREGDQPYNDLEYYVFIRGNRFLSGRQYGAALNQLAHQISKVAKVEVEFHLISCAQLRRTGPSMFYYDLIAGHRQLHRNGDALHGCEHHRQAESLPLAEATRLLMNRGTGLLLGREKLSGKSLTKDDRDFIARNIAKAQLALGDAVLTVCGRYHWSCRERNRRLPALHGDVITQPWFNAVRHHHDSGVAFKLHPHRSDASAGELWTQFEIVTHLLQQVWLWTESQRLQIKFSSARQYASSAVDKCPESSPWRNRMLNAWIFGPASLILPSSRRHPRERVLNALPILLWESKESVALASAILTIPGSSAYSMHPTEVYKKLWQRVR